MRPEHTAQGLAAEPGAAPLHPRRANPTTDTELAAVELAQPIVPVPTMIAASAAPMRANAGA